MQKIIPNSPHEVLLVLDGSTGQNAFEQAKQFTKATQITSLAITKLDGTAKGGVVIGISDLTSIFAEEPQCAKQRSGASGDSGGSSNKCHSSRIVV